MNKTFLAFSCTHHPLHDPDAIDWLLGKVSDLQPDVIVNLGDTLEAASASRFVNESRWSLEDEYDAAGAFLRDIRHTSRKSKLIYCWGNHEANIVEAGRIQPGLRSLCTPGRNMPELRHWKQLPYIYSKRGVYRLGAVSFAHGYECGTASNDNQSILLGQPFGLFVSGHTHRPTPVTQAMKTKRIPLPYWSANAGCLRNLDADYAARSNTFQWGQGCVVGEVQITKSPRMSRTWDAHTEVFRMYE